MEKEKVSELMEKYANYVPNDKIDYLKKRFEKASDEDFEINELINIHEPWLILFVSIIGGLLGMDRFILGDIGIGLCKLLLTLCPLSVLFIASLFGLWYLFVIVPIICWLLDIVLCLARCREVNLLNIMQFF